MHFNCRQALVKEFLSLSVLLLFAFSSIAQNRNYLSGKLAKEKVLFAQKVETEGESKIKRVVFEDNVSFDVVRQFSQSLKLSDDLDLKLIEKKVDKYGFEHIKYQQTYKGIEVFGNEFIFHCKGDVVKSANGTLLQKIELETQPTLAEDAALAIAIKKVGAENYMWENSKYEGLLKSETNNASATYYPTAKLGLSRHKFNPDNPLVLVYQLEVYAANPIGRYHIEIDAKTGEIVNFFNKLHNAEATGTGISLYNGEVALDIDFDGSDYFLSETLRGDGIFTYDMMNSSNYSSATLFSESDNLFDEENSRAGVSAHYGAAATYDYFYNNFGRDSYDDGGAAINSYVHFGTNYVNAFWDGSRMTYGDGDGVETTPLVSLDIVGHEITHAVTERSAGLIYAYESGALNESFSDIFGQSVEFETSPSTANWNLADEIFTDGIRMIRSMSDPNSQGDPDTYQGTNWEFGDFDNGGVHINSGVMNYWFYLLVDGGGGTNDNGFDYSVTGIGLSDAQQIAYRNLTIYLTANSQYLDARVGAEQSAIDIFGEGSQQHLSVVDAWNAVGVPTAEPLLAVQEAIDFGSIPIGLTSVYELQISNQGNSLLLVENITSDNSGFIVSDASLSVAATSSEIITVSFTPSELGVVDGSISLESNGGDQVISIAGTGVEPPVISIDPTSFTEALFTGGTATQTLNIANTEGGSDLVWSLSINTQLEEPIAPFVQGQGITSGFNNSGQRISSNLNGEFGAIEGEFEEHTSSPANLTCMTIDDDLGIIYAQANSDTRFYSYSISDDSWGELASSPLSSGNNGGAVFLDGKVYTSYTSSSSLGIYDTETDTWDQIATPISTGNIAADENYIYLALGTSFYRMDPTENSFQELGSSPISFNAWGGLSYYSGYIYGHQGDGGIEFARYNIASNEWEELPSLPSGAVLGSAIDQSTGDYYAYGSYGGTNFYKYDLESSEWSASTIPYFSVNDGGLVYYGGSTDAGIYFIQGESGTGLASFGVSPLSTWLELAEVDGSVSAGSAQGVDIVFDALGMNGGVYEAILELSSNDPSNSFIEIPVTLEVTGAPDILLSETTLDYGAHFIGASIKDSIQIENAGTDLLDITSITVDNSDYLLNSTTLQLSPGESEFLVITYTPLEVEVDNATITITSNDSDEGEISVDLTGTSVEPPIISVNPLSLSEELLSGETSEQEIIISNEGSSDLTWTIGNISGVSALFKEFKSNYYTVEHSDSNNSGLASVAPIPMDVLESLSGSVDVLAWTLYADMTIEYPNTINAISQYFTDFTVTTTSTTASSELEALLESKDVFLIPEQEGGSGSFYASLGIEWSEVLNDFIGSGGHIILCGASSGVESLLNSSGLLSLESVSQLSDGTMEVSDIPHGIIEGIPTTISAQNATFSCNVIDVDASILVTLSSKATVVSRELGNGTVSFVGFDFYEYDDDAAQIIANAVSYSTVANWLTTPTTEGVIEAGESETITIEFDATELNGGTYEASINLSSNDPLNPSIDIPVSLDVTGIPDIESENSVSFGEVFIGAEVEETFLVSNVGTEVLNISDVRISNQDFSLDKSSLTLSSGASEEILITYNPEEAELDNTTLTFVSDDPDEGILEIDIFAEGVEPPSISVESSIEIDVVVGNTVEEDLEIENLGGSDLNWSLAIDYTAAQPSGVNNPKLKYMEVGKGQKDTRVGFEVNRGAGGPDVIGYSWVDSDEEIGPDFEWEDISSTGINVTSYLSDDNVAGSFPIGFDFEFYGNSYDEFFISSNGFISFSNDVSSGCCSGQPIPLNDGVNNIIAWAWRDGYPFGNVYYQNFSDKTIIQFDGYGLCCSESSGSATAEIILYADGRIKINYLSLTGSYLDPLSTIGIENEDGTDGLQVAMNTTYLHDNLSILFSQTPEWIVADVTSGSISAGSSTLVSLDLGNADLEVGTYNAVISVSSNDPLNGTVEIPVTMNVIEPRYLDLTPNLREVGFEAGQTLFSVETNLSSYNVSSDAEWVSVQKGQDEVILSYEKNESAPRTAVITVSNGPLSEKFALIQEENGDVLGINDPQIRVYPNPTTGRVFIEEEFSDITVTDISGKKVDYSINALPNGSEIDMSKLNTGLYNLVISLKDGSTRSIKILLRK